MLPCHSPAGLSPGGEEGGWQQGRWGPGTAPEPSRLHPGSIPNRPVFSARVKPRGRWVETQNSSSCWHGRGSREFPRSGPSPLAAGQGARESGQAPTGPWDHRAGGCSPTAAGAGSPTLDVPGCCLRLCPATEVPADAKARIVSSLLAWLLLRVYSAFTQAVLAPSMAGEGAVWRSPRGSCPTSDLPHAACPALSSTKVQPAEPEVFE